MIGPGAPGIVYVTFRPELAAAFRRLNLEWLEGHGLLEPADMPRLDAPAELIVARGGQVFFALEAGVPVGCCAAVPVGPGVVELAKLAVTAAAQGRGIGRALCLLVRDFARDLGARTLNLTSSTKLGSALRLYESLGFRRLPLPPDVPYATADVYMELALDA